MTPEESQILADSIETYGLSLATKDINVQVYYDNRPLVRELKMYIWAPKIHKEPEINGFIIYWYCKHPQEEFKREIDDIFNKINELLKS